MKKNFREWDDSLNYYVVLISINGLYYELDFDTKEKALISIQELKVKGYRILDTWYYIDGKFKGMFY